MNSYTELYHHGIKGQKWNVRRYQNEDGSLTPEGRARYGYEGLSGQEARRVYKQDVKQINKYYGKNKNSADARHEREQAMKLAYKNTSMKATAQRSCRESLRQLVGLAISGVVTAIGVGTITSGHTAAGMILTGLGGASMASLAGHTIKNDVRTSRDMARVRNYSDSYKEGEQRLKENISNTYDKLKKKVTDK
mgnify:CR=1 FL=1